MISSGGVIDTQSNSPDRHRRNWQRIGKGALTKTIKVSGPITNTGGSLGLALGDNSLKVVGNALEVKLSATGGLSLAGDGLAVGVDNSTLIVDGSNKLTVQYPRLLIGSRVGSAFTETTSDQVFSAPYNVVLPSGYIQASNPTIFRLSAVFRFVVGGSSTTVAYNFRINGTPILSIINTLTVGTGHFGQAILNVSFYLTPTECDVYGAVEFIVSGSVGNFGPIEIATPVSASGAVTIDFVAHGDVTDASNTLNLDSVVLEVLSTEFLAAGGVP